VAGGVGNDLLDFGVDRGSVGRGNAKKRAIKIARLDDLGTGGDGLGTVENAKTVPAENPIDNSLLLF
jgi:hypothetical protein